MTFLAFCGVFDVNSELVYTVGICEGQMSEQTARSELTTRQAAALLGRDVSQVRRWLYSGRLQGRQPDGWTWFVERSSVVRLKAELDERKKKDG